MTLLLLVLYVQFISLLQLPLQTVGTPSTASRPSIRSYQVGTASTHMRCSHTSLTIIAVDADSCISFQDLVICLYYQYVNPVWQDGFRTEMSCASTDVCRDLYRA